MIGRKKRGLIGNATGFLARLRKDSAGNVLAVMAMMMIPLAALTGSAIDMGRLYAVKSRLQQACDAGALAGRKTMTDLSGTTLPTASAQSAKAFFNSNFKTSWLLAKSVTFTPGRSGNVVTGTASATVPLTIMQWVFDQTDKSVSVTCAARYDTADADIMFVLDTTGSMAQVLPGSSGRKIDGLKSAVLSFYDTLKASITDPTVNVRYGFVTYSSSVNVGSVLPTADLVTRWQYQSRKVTGDQNAGYTDSSGNFHPVAQNVTTANLTQADCLAKQGRNPVTPLTYKTDGTAIVTTVGWAGGVCTITQQTVMPKWDYELYTKIDIPAAFLNGTGVPDWTKVTGATTSWEGCVEERNTQVGYTYTTDIDQNNLPADLDPDLVPKADVDSNGMPTVNDTRWRPMWRDITYGRYGAAGVDTQPTTAAPYGDNPATYPNLNTTTCGKAASALKVMSRDDVSNYVNASDFKPAGNTYHDYGMTWGTRLISPTGPFYPKPLGSSDPNRYIVFMTDGDMEPSSTVYSSQGIEALDQRVTGGALSKMTTYHNSRFVAECTAAKRRGITVFVIGFGQTVTSQMTACATSPQKAFFASDNASLTSVFNQIAQQIAQLRISQ